ncbi:hypothetical protein LCGC14_2819620 [marine sediment metagenome]|uniref:Z-binding domain-containing protein n=1 Tax=marine sediment metagenome TaxID=412755 RepID=A0A0F8YHD9_9ZZZZ
MTETVIDFTEQVFSELGTGPIKASVLAEKFGVEKVQVVVVLNDLRKIGRVECSGRGRGATWFTKVETCGTTTCE